MASFTSGELIAIVIQLLIVLLVLRRSYAMVGGVPYSAPRLVLLPGLILVIWGLDELESLLLTPWALPYLIALDVALLLVAAFGVAGVAQRMTRVDRGESGQWTYRIGFSLAALFLVAFVLRLALALALFPSSLEFGAPPGGYPPVAQQLALAAIDALFSLSAGLLVGRSVGIYRAVESARAQVGATRTR